MGACVIALLRKEYAMSAFRFYTVLAIVFGLIFWMFSLFDPTESRGNPAPIPAAHAAPKDAGIERIAQGFDR